MGVGPLDKISICPVCSNNEHNCPGHLGHIKLVFPIYNIFLFKDIHRLLQSKCFNCHRFTMSPNIMKNFSLILKCLKLGLMKQFQFFRDFEIYYIEKKALSDRKTKRKPSKSTAKSESETQQAPNQAKDKEH